MSNLRAPDWRWQCDDVQSQLGWRRPAPPAPPRASHSSSAACVSQVGSCHAAPFALSPRARAGPAPVAVPVKRTDGDGVRRHIGHQRLKPLVAIPHLNLGQLVGCGWGLRRERPGRMGGGASAPATPPSEPAAALSRAVSAAAGASCSSIMHASHRWLPRRSHEGPGERAASPASAGERVQGHAPPLAALPPGRPCRRAGPQRPSPAPQQLQGQTWPAVLAGAVGTCCKEERD